MRLRTVRLGRGWSQEELADRAGLDRTYIGSVERGQRNIALLNIVRIAVALGVDPGELVQGTGEEKDDDRSDHDGP
jgi:transcriptional regulator with XRE-family HTH domain